MANTAAAARGSGAIDYLVLDSAAGATAQELSDLVKAVDVVVVPTAPAMLDLRALRQTLTSTEAARRQNTEQSLPDFCKILLTLAPPHPNQDGALARARLTGDGLPLFQAAIGRRAIIARAFEREPGL